MTEKYRGGEYKQEKPFSEMLSISQSRNNYLSIGLDPDPERIPESIKHARYLRNTPERHATEFLKEIVDKTYDFTCVYKLNVAHYLALGVDGVTTMVDTIERIRKYNVPTIIDAKCGDVKDTNIFRARAIFDLWGWDAVTVNPWVGSSQFALDEHVLDAFEPFISKDKKGIFIWCRSSNPSSGQIQDLPIKLSEIPQEYKERYGDFSELGEIVDSDIVPEYQVLAYIASKFWNRNGNIGFIVGATQPKALTAVRRIVGEDVQILIPGIGEQKGDLKTAVKNGVNSKGSGIIPSSSRSIIYASCPEREAEKLRDEINLYRTA